MAENRQILAGVPELRARLQSDRGRDGRHDCSRDFRDYNLCGGQVGGLTAHKLAERDQLSISQSNEKNLKQICAQLVAAAPVNDNFMEIKENKEILATNFTHFHAFAGSAFDRTFHF